MTRLRQVSEAVFIAGEGIVTVGQDDIDHLTARVGATTHKRIRLCAHRSVDDRVHEMLIVAAREAYIRPHKHLNKAESLHVIQGSADAVFFDEAGRVREVVGLGNYASGRRFFYRIAEPVYHTLLIRSAVLVFHEAVQGPFVRTDTVFAPWAPDEGSAAVEAYLDRLTSAVHAHAAPHGPRG